MSMIKALFATSFLFVVNACGTPESDSSDLAASSSSSSASCAYNINGKSFKGKNKAECDALKKAQGGSFNKPGSLPANPKASSVSCAYAINGEVKKGSTQAECDKLKSELSAGFPQPQQPVIPAPTLPAPDSISVVSCAYAINGEVKKGSTQAECDKLKSEAGASFPQPQIPVIPAPTPTAPSGVSQVSCAFNINGVLTQGKTQAECDALRAQLGF